MILVLVYYLEPDSWLFLYVVCIFESFLYTHDHAKSELRHTYRLTCWARDALDHGYRRDLFRVTRSPCHHG
jgi:hypothetical protein